MMDDKFEYSSLHPTSPPLQLGGPLLRTKAMPLPTSN